MMDEFADSKQRMLPLRTCKLQVITFATHSVHFRPITSQQQADDDDSCRWSRAMGLQWTSDARGAELQSSQLRWLRGMCEAVLETVRPGWRSDDAP